MEYQHPVEVCFWYDIDGGWASFSPSLWEESVAWNWYGRYITYYWITIGRGTITIVVVAHDHASWSRRTSDVNSLIYQTHNLPIEGFYGNIIMILNINLIWLLHRLSNPLPTSKATIVIDLSRLRSFTVSPSRLLPPILICCHLIPTTKTTVVAIILAVVAMSISHGFVIMSVRSRWSRLKRNFHGWLLMVSYILYIARIKNVTWIPLSLENKKHVYSRIHQDIYFICDILSFALIHIGIMDFLA